MQCMHNQKYLLQKSCLRRVPCHMQDFSVHNVTKLTALTILLVTLMILLQTILVLLWLNCVMYKTQQDLDISYQLVALVLTH